jgi:hypothetical protein
MSTARGTNDLYQLKVGDRVQVFSVNGPRRGQPKGGEDGTVTKVGRKLVTVEYGYGSKVFRMEDGSINDDYGHVHIKTVEQAAEDLRRGDALDQLREAGVVIQFDRKFSTETLEALAEIAAGSGLSGHGVESGAE